MTKDRIPRPMGFSYESALETIEAVFNVARDGGAPLTKIEISDFWTAYGWLKEYAENANV